MSQAKSKGVKQKVQMPASLRNTKKVHDLLPEMLDRVKSMLRHTWNQIACDAEELLPPGKKQRVACIVEFVTDADRFRTYGDDPEAEAAWDSLTFKEQNKLATETLKGYA